MQAATRQGAATSSQHAPQGHCAQRCNEGIAAMKQLRPAWAAIPAICGALARLCTVCLVNLMSLVSLASVLSIAPAHAAETLELRTAAQLATAPKFIAQGDGAAGLCIDLHRAIERLDPAIRITGDQQWRPLLRLEAELRSGSLDMACGLMRNREREAELAYLEPSLFSVTYFLVARADDAVDVAGWDDVRNLGDKGAILAMHGFGQVARLKDTVARLNRVLAQLDGSGELRRLFGKWYDDSGTSAGAGNACAARVPAR